MTTEQVPVSGFNVPPLPAGGHERQAPPANMQPGFVPPAAAPVAPAAGTFTQAQMDAAIAAAVAGKAPAPAAPVAAPATPASLSTATDPVLSSLTSAFTAVGQGVDMDRAFGKALEFGDPSLIDLAYIAEKGGAAAENLKAIAKGIVDRVQYQAQAGEAAVYAIAGDKVQWDTALALFDAKASPHVKLVVKTMIDSGNVGSISAAAQMVVEFSKGSGRMVNVPGLITAGAPNSNSADGLSKQAFQALHQKLDPNSPSYTADRGQLMQRRSVGKQLGL